MPNRGELFLIKKKYIGGMIISNMNCMLNKNFID